MHNASTGLDPWNAGLKSYYKIEKQRRTRRLIRLNRDVRLANDAELTSGNRFAAAARILVHTAMLAQAQVSDLQLFELGRALEHWRTAKQRGIEPLLEAERLLQSTGFVGASPGPDGGISRDLEHARLSTPPAFEQRLQGTSRGVSPAEQLARILGLRERAVQGQGDSAELVRITARPPPILTGALPGGMSRSRPAATR
jgi:hypothetical protein